MHKLAILSRDYDLYRELIESAGLQNIAIIAACDDVDKIEELNEIDILLEYRFQTVYCLLVVFVS